MMKMSQNLPQNLGFIGKHLFRVTKKRRTELLVYFESPVVY